MEEFSLEKYLKNPNRKIVTRDGKSVRIVCTDRECMDFPIVALIKFKDCEGVCMFSTYGQCCDSKDDELDLFFAPKKKVYSFKEGDRV